MTDIRRDITAYLTIVPSATSDMIAMETGLGLREVQTTLHAMDDDGDVLMRGGWYRLSEAKKAGRGSPHPSDQTLEALYPASSLPEAEEEDTSG